MFRKRADRTKPVDPPEGYAWHVSRSMIPGERFQLELLPKRLMEVQKNGGWYWRTKAADSNFPKGTLVPIYDNLGECFNRPEQIRRASKKVLRKRELRIAQKKMEENVRSLVNDHT